MSKIEDIIISDNIGEKYTFEVYPRKTEEFKSVGVVVGGVYMFIKRGANQHGTWHKILYIGQTESFKDRVNYNHGKWFSAIKMGFTHICVLQVDNRDWFERERIRRLIEKRLIRAYNPPLNKNVG